MFEEGGRLFRRDDRGFLVDQDNILLVPGDDRSLFLHILITAHCGRSQSKYQSPTYCFCYAVGSMNFAWSVGLAAASRAFTIYAEPTMVTGLPSSHPVDSGYVPLFHDFVCHTTRRRELDGLNREFADCRDRRRRSKAGLRHW
uniref:Uncharacterized protein n=1 Tax=Spongospora subterranea TaxID=70186 RepID=A0A0H5RC23_9EUKA|eukprot:CRZ06054.1 hypothetical protein [Spongospora subterranea]